VSARGYNTSAEHFMAQRLTTLTAERDHLRKELERHRQALREIEGENASLRTRLRALGGAGE
jgi:chromosome segregation ATPase